MNCNHLGKLIHVISTLLVRMTLALKESKNDERVLRVVRYISVVVVY